MNVDKAVDIVECELTHWAMMHLAGDNGVRYNSSEILSAIATVKDWVHTHTIITEKLKKDLKFYQHALNPGSNPDDE